MFQLNPLIPFLFRAIARGYQFQLGTEMPGMGGKFEYLIFKYEIKDCTSTNIAGCLWSIAIDVYTGVGETGPILDTVPGWTEALKIEK